MSILNVKSVTHGYGERTLLQDVSLRLLQGDHAGLVGANGSGKSTLLRILTGQILPDVGFVEWSPNVEYGYLEQHISYPANQTLRDFLRAAFSHLFLLEVELIHISNEMANASDGTLDKLLRRFAELQEELEQHDFYGIDAKIDRVAVGLGLLQAVGLDTPMDHLSGGQRTKASLAQLLLRQPGTLVLDEPTNYLDALHVNWLIEYLQSYPSAFLVVSHDVAFLDGIVNVVFHLEHRAATRYSGTYPQYVEAYELRKNQTLNDYQHQRAEIEKLETYIQKNKVRKSTSKQAKSREKRLEKIKRIEKPGQNGKLNVQFQVSAEPASIIVKARQLDVGYTQPLWSDLNLTLKRGEKIALTGINGIGKTTLLKTLLGIVPPQSGTLTYGLNVVPAYFAQEFQFKENRTALEEVWQAFPSLTQREVRQALARCGLQADHVLQYTSQLSGGEQTKVRLCKLMLSPSNWLVLDEPTNHLDAVARDAFRQALSVYQGTVLLVSHERAFYEGVVSRVWSADEMNTDVRRRRM